MSIYIQAFVAEYLSGRNASQNHIGRLMLREDGTGAIEYFYGKIGEVTKTRRTMIVPNQAIATYVTQWTYDSHNRLLEMIYPDEEKITYSYNLGGQLEKVHGYKSYGYDYVSKIGYDKFEQRTYLKYCNGAETFYTYDPQRRRLQNLMVNSGGNTIMDNAYTYDTVSNVLSVINGASVPKSGKAGGQMAHTYTYDALYRLVSATGTYTGADNKTASYTLAMGYDNMHRITSKRQILTQNNVQFNGTLNAGYDLSYTYGTDTGKKFQLANVKDVNYRTEETPSESENVNNNHAYEYDANGNLVYVNTSRTKKDGMADEKTAERKLKWDEENRLLASDDNGFVTNYWYDADGERTVKTSGESDQVYVNSEFAGGRTNTAKFSLYESPYLVANQGGRYTKHIYIGSQRVVSKIGDFDSYGSDPRRIQYAGSETDGLSVDYKQKYAQQLQVIKDNYATFAVPYNGEDNNDYVDGKGFCCNDGSLEAAQARAIARAAKNNFQEGDTYEKMQFYYHPDHLGSSSYITTLDGEVVQHIEYVPFGEVFMEERNNFTNRVVMKAMIILLVFSCLLFSCSNNSREKSVDSSELSNIDYRLFQNTPAWELAKAVQEEDMDNFDKIISENPQIINYQESKYGNTLLMLTIINQQLKPFKALLKKGAAVKKLSLRITIFYGHIQYLPLFGHQLYLCQSLIESYTL